MFKFSEYDVIACFCKFRYVLCCETRFRFYRVHTETYTALCNVSYMSTLFTSIAIASLLVEL